MFGLPLAVHFHATQGIYLYTFVSESIALNSGTSAAETTVINLIWPYETSVILINDPN